MSDAMHSQRMGEQALTPAELLATLPVQSINNTAVILGLLRRNGQPNRRAVYKLIDDKVLRPVNPDVSIKTIASDEIRRYIAGTEAGAA